VRGLLEEVDSRLGNLVNAKDEEDLLDAATSAAVIAQLGEFVKMWRRDFVQKMQPRNMPRDWSVDSRVSSSRKTRRVA